MTAGHCVSPGAAPTRPTSGGPDDLMSRAEASRTGRSGTAGDGEAENARTATRRALLPCMTTDAFDRIFGTGRRGSGAASSRVADLPIVRRECLGIARAFGLATNGHADDVLEAARQEKTGWKQVYLLQAVTLATADEFFPWARRHLDLLLLDARARCDSGPVTRAKFIVDDPALMRCLIGGVSHSLQGCGAPA